MSTHSVRGWKWSEYTRHFLARNRFCWLCYRQIDLALRHPDPMSGTVDHVTPVSKGGSKWDPANHRPAHRICNLQRGVKMVEPLGSTSRAW